MAERFTAEGLMAENLNPDGPSNSRAAAYSSFEFYMSLCRYKRVERVI